MSLKITTLIENNSDENNILLSEHGLSLYIEIDEMKILFDTGQSGDFIKNAEKLKIDLNNLDYVILSHGHYDHSGGFTKLVENTKNPFKLIVGNRFFNKKYKLLESDEYKFNGNSFDEKFINRNNISTKYIDQDSFNITEDAILFSNFERNTDFEVLNKKFYIKQNDEYMIDDFSDEIVLTVKTEKGLVVILGCSHVGVVNIFVPGHAHDVLGAGAGLAQHLHDVLQRLADLLAQVVGVEHALRIPTDHAGHEDHAAFGGDAVGIALGARPAGRKKNLHAGLLREKRGFRDGPDRARSAPAPRAHPAGCRWRGGSAGW